MAKTYTPRLGLASYSAGTDAFLDRTTYDNDMAALETLSAIDMQGVASARPAASAALKGAYWWSTDTAVLSRCDGAAWTQLYPVTRAVYSSGGVAIAGFSVAEINVLNIPAVARPVLIQVNYTGMLAAYGGEAWDVNLKIDLVNQSSTRHVTTADINGGMWISPVLAYAWLDSSGLGHQIAVDVVRYNGTQTASSFNDGLHNNLYVTVIG